MPITVDSRFPDATTTGRLRTEHGETWYRVTGELTPGEGPAPLVVLHGGPGAAHNYTLMMANLSADGRAVVHYDQLGCGESTHRPDAPADFWTVELFVAELRALVEHLGIGDRFHLLGQSWGGMLAPEVVLADERGVLSLTICDSPASMALWLSAANALREELPADVQQTLLRHEEAGTTDSPEYLEAMQVFYDRHVCRVVPNPPEVTDSFAQIEEEPTVYHTMNGPSEFHVVGTLKEWSVAERVGGIRVPTLVVAGAHDEARPEVWAPFVDGIPGAVSHVFPESSHMPHVEEPEAFQQVVGDFLRAHDGGAR
ncbi:proline iminopeptidase-family hydrolase [Lapillicoccus jejuensis]|uniref:Proline iminopeptidase n=1 Tax=Lapillicoccus jejuensis TaxID=402171 RepID=A0A542DZP3_9MICO|nr:proline iminopeptidase-family hydrolase [Lapillicoccus jejuensis]TQJ08509.1 tricorn interacting aminopeptidase F1 [Lapillicoccus jejuensis]